MSQSTYGKGPTSDRPSPDDGFSSCDWGGCNEEGEFWRWSHELKEWLPVCRRHSTKADRDAVETTSTETMGGHNNG